MSEGLKIVLHDFEGPLDLLLHLIKEAKIDIRDIFVSEVTGQFLVYMSEIHTLDVDKASEFMETAATLVEIKSRALLPKLEEMLPPEEDPKEKLFRQLEEYKLFQSATESLKNLENTNRFYKPPELEAGDVRHILKDMTLEALLNAYAKILHKIDKTAREFLQKKINREPFSVEEKITFIRDALIVRKQVSFFELFDSSSDRGEVIATFLALLELLKLQFVKAVQNEIYDDIIIKITDAGENAEEIEIEDIAEETEE